jgi:hypothetical protein
LTWKKVIENCNDHQSMTQLNTEPALMLDFFPPTRNQENPLRLSWYCIYMGIFDIFWGGNAKPSIVVAQNDRPYFVRLCPLIVTRAPRNDGGGNKQATFIQQQGSKPPLCSLRSGVCFHLSLS